MRLFGPRYSPFSRVRYRLIDGVLLRPLYFTLPYKFFSARARSHEASDPARLASIRPRHTKPDNDTRTLIELHRLPREVRRGAARRGDPLMKKFCNKMKRKEEAKTGWYKEGIEFFSYDPETHLSESVVSQRARAFAGARSALRSVTHWKKRHRTKERGRQLLRPERHNTLHAASAYMEYEARRGQTWPGMASDGVL